MFYRHEINDTDIHQCVAVCGIWTNNPTYSLQKQVTAAAVQAQFRERYEINTSLRGIRHVEHGWITGPMYSSGSQCNEYYNTLPSVIGLTVKVQTCSLGIKKAALCNHTHVLCHV